MARSTDELLTELVMHLTGIARERGNVLPAPQSTALEDALLLARSIRYGWTEPRRDEDETPTVQFPPIGSTTRRRPPVPAARVVELTDRVELLQALGRELQRELGELRAVDDDQADDTGRDQ